jgi:hypothetical protein
MQRIKPDVDIILDILNAVLEAQPQSSFTQSLLLQYQQRGSLSKKQLQGLYSKAQKVDSILPGKLATLEAIILKRPNRDKSELPENTPLYTKDERVGEMIKEILLKYPEHKRVLFIRTKYNNNEVLQPAELTDLQRFHNIVRSK